MISDDYFHYAFNLQDIFSKYTVTSPNSFCRTNPKDNQLNKKKTWKSAKSFTLCSLKQWLMNESIITLAFLLIDI